MSTPATPSEQHEADIDAVCERIDAALPRIRERSKTPSTGFRPSKIQATKKVFQQMSDDSLLTQSGEDIRLTEMELAQAEREKAAMAARRGRKSGAHPRVIIDPTPPTP